MVILPSSVTLQTPEQVGVRDLPEFSLRLGLTSVPLPGPVGFAAAGAGVAGATWAVCPAKRSCPVPISRNNRRFTCEFSSPLPWHATQTSVSPPTGTTGGVCGSGDITGACDQWTELGPCAPGGAGASPATRESPAGIVSADNLPEPGATTRWASPCPALSETGVTMSTAVFGVTMSTVAVGGLAISALTGAEPRAAASFRAISSTALFGEGVRGWTLPADFFSVQRLHGFRQVVQQVCTCRKLDW